MALTEIIGKYVQEITQIQIEAKHLEGRQKDEFLHVQMKRLAIIIFQQLKDRKFEELKTKRKEGLNE